MSRKGLTSNLPTCILQKRAMTTKKQAAKKSFLISFAAKLKICIRKSLFCRLWSLCVFFKAKHDHERTVIILNNLSREKFLSFSWRELRGEKRQLFHWRGSGSDVKGKVLWLWKFHDFPGGWTTRTFRKHILVELVNFPDRRVTLGDATNRLVLPTKKLFAGFSFPLWLLSLAGCSVFFREGIV